MRTVRRRRELILGLIATRRVETQEELVEALHAAGAVASQASVSRDIQALGLVKIGGQWALPAPPEHGRNPAEERLRSYLLEATPAGPYLLVLKTPPGEAPGVGLAFDRLELKGAVGSVAGDDTVFVAVSSAGAGRAIARRLAAICTRAASPVRGVSRRVKLRT
jgi:transcriptional regulator of arginine metabolism